MSEKLTATEVLQSLRWGPDRQVVNPFGDHVWLKQMPPLLPSLPKGYVTECCFVDNPCDHHRSQTAEGDVT